MLSDRFEGCLRILHRSGAFYMPHSGANLHSHLVGTAAILERWEQEEDVLLAGLCHSLIGPGSQVLLEASTRERLIELLGVQGLRLVLLFAIRNRTRLYIDAADEVPLDRQDLAALAHLTLANTVEQMARCGVAAEPRGLHTEVFTGLLNATARGEADFLLAPAP